MNYLKPWPFLEHVSHVAHVSVAAPLVHIQDRWKRLVLGLVALFQAIHHRLEPLALTDSQHRVQDLAVLVADAGDEPVFLPVQATKLFPNLT